MNQTADSFRGDGVVYERGKPVAKVNTGTATKVKTLNDLASDQLPKVYNRLAQVAEYDDRTSFQRPNLWGMLIRAVRATICRNPEGLTLAQLTLEMGEYVTTRNVMWSLEKMIGSGDVVRGVQGDHDWTVYQPSRNLIRG
jgi:hypothetical protein